MDELQRLWQQAVAAHASKPALTYQRDGSVTTFAKLHEAVEALASELRVAGATAGRAVAYAVDERAPAKKATSRPSRLWKAMRARETYGKPSG